MTGTRNARADGRGRRHARGTAGASRSMVSSAGDRFSDLTERAGDISDDIASSAADAASSVGRSAGRAVDAAAEAASSAGARAYDAASSAYRSAAETAYDIGRRAPRTASWLGDELSELGTRYPLLLGAVTLAVGAALGGAMRTSERENRLMGALSDKFRQRAWDAADEQFDRAKEAAGAVADRLRAQFGPEERADRSADFETVIGGGKPGDGSGERTPVSGR
jgi:hypothetical protein